MRIIQITDTHLFADPAATLLNLNTAQSFQAVIAHVKLCTPSPDMIILSGDISQDYSPDSYRYAAKACETFGCPVYWIPGNHDAVDVMQKIFATTPLKNDKAILLGDWLIILLNSNYPYHAEGLLTRAELAHLDYYLSQYPKQHTLIFLHHPPVAVGSVWLDQSQLKNSDNFFAVLDRYSQVRGIVCGHVHQEFATQRRGVPILTTPSTCLQFLPNSKPFALDKRHPGYRWLTLNAEGQFISGVERLTQFDNTIDYNAKGY